MSNVIAIIAAMAGVGLLFGLALAIVAGCLVLSFFGFFRTIK